MQTAGLNGLTLIYFAFFNLFDNVGRTALGFLGVMLELGVFLALVWALLGSKTRGKKIRQTQNMRTHDSQRFRARQKELTLR